jgi:hypothetical protein
MKTINTLALIMFVFSLGCDIGNPSDSKSVVDPIFGGKGNLRYDPLTESFLFDGYKDDYFLDINGQVSSEMVFFDDPGSYKLKYPGRYKIALLKGKDTIDSSLTFHKEKNYGSNFVYNTNLQEHGFEEPLYGTLNDGLLGSINPRDGQWWCWKNKDAAIVIDLGAQIFIKSLGFRYYEDIAQKIYPPSSIKISGSYDGEKYMTFFGRSNLEPAPLYFKDQLAVINNNFRYYRIDLFAHNNDNSENAPASYLLLDEVVLKEGTAFPTEQK